MAVPNLLFWPSTLGSSEKVMCARAHWDFSFLEQVASSEDLQQAVFQLRDYLGVNHVIYWSTSAQGVIYAALTYPLEWIERYVEQRYHEIDPVPQGAARRFAPFDWRTLDWTSESAADLRKRAIAMGMGHQGYSIPLRSDGGRFAIFSVNADMEDDDWAKFTERLAPELLFIANFVDRRAAEFAEVTDIPATEPLMPREIEVLSLLASGQTIEEAAEYLNISQHIFRFYVEGARNKLGARNTLHTVAEATSKGLIKA